MKTKDNKMKRGRKSLLENRPLMFSLIFIIVSLSTVIAGDLIVKNGDLYVDSSTNRLGIGTSTPANPLQIMQDSNTYMNVTAYNIGIEEGSLNANGPRFTLGWSGGPVGIIDLIFANRNTEGLRMGTLYAYPVSIISNGGTAIYIDTTKKVGIGTNLTDQKLKVLGSVNITGDIHYDGSLIPYSPMMVESVDGGQSILGMKADNGEWVGCGVFYKSESSSYEWQCKPMQEVNDKLTKNEARRNCENQNMIFDSGSCVGLTENNDGNNVEANVDL